MSDVLTLRQLAEHFQLSERTIYCLLGRGQPPGFKVGGYRRFRASSRDVVRLVRNTERELFTHSAPPVS